MEHSTKFLSLSGLSGVSTGFVGLIGAITGYWYLEKTGGYNTSLYRFAQDNELVITFFIGAPIW